MFGSTFIYSDPDSSFLLYLEPDYTEIQIFNQEKLKEMWWRFLGQKDALKAPIIHLAQ